MKKFFILLIVFVILSNCDIKPRSSYAYNQVSWTYREENHNGMDYGIWWTDGDGGNREDAVFVVNITKEKLEVEMLKLQIEKLKK